MAMYEAHIYISEHYELIPNVMVLPYTAHFQQLIHLFAPSCNFFELTCFQEETELLQDVEQRIRSKGILKEIRHPTYATVCLVGELSSTIVDEFLIKPFDEYGRIKWFDLSLGKASNLTFERNTEMTRILELAHWGQESHIFRMSDEELKVVQDIFLCLPIVVDYQQITE